MSERDSVSTGYLYFDVDLVFGAASSQRNRVKGDSFFLCRQHVVMRRSLSREYEKGAGG